MALVDIAATAEDNILQAEDLRELIQEDLRYRDKQLLRLKDEVLDLEDFNESVALNEFTLDDFRMELAAYIEANREKLEEAPFGLYAVVPPHAEYQTIKPGAIYCLKQRIEAAATKPSIRCSPISWSTSVTTAKCATTSPVPSRCWKSSAPCARARRSPTPTCANCSTWRRNTGKT
jgi:hypothetical protein